MKALTHNQIKISLIAIIQLQNPQTHILLQDEEKMIAILVKFIEALNVSSVKALGTFKMNVPPT